MKSSRTAVCVVYGCKVVKRMAVSSDSAILYLNKVNFCTIFSSQLIHFFLSGAAPSSKWVDNLGNYINILIIKKN